jgi:hypothetical protein
MFAFLICVFVFYIVYSVFVLSCILFLLLYIAVSFLFFAQVYRPLPQGGNPTAVNKYHISMQHVVLGLISACHLKLHKTPIFGTFIASSGYDS